eukprot:TRINITY_DN13327_c0_g1_i2.p1 TRINITY_DN13327_c0_g1~~TRINITY_DN13327_c0_g1_i2.p1  ORF type:complete len:764 (-),score=187.91 TRINITY_DN13327_c0_g1_i2:315-2606(-)
MKNSLLTTLRNVVSGDKERYKKDGFDVDLTYITDRLIAMSFPAEGVESTYRNNINEISALLAKNHGADFMIYNLSHRSYDESKFGGRVVSDYGWPDHHNPPLLKLFRAVKSIHTYLSAAPEHVVVVHCLAGKGRTGVLIACYMLYTGLFNNNFAARSYFANKRSLTNWGVASPAQIRYVEYFEYILKYGAPDPVPLRLVSIKFHKIPWIGSRGCTPLIEVLDFNEISKTQEVIWSNIHSPRFLPATLPSYIFRVDSVIQGDVYVLLRHIPSLGPTFQKMGFFSFNTGMVVHQASEIYNLEPAEKKLNDSNRIQILKLSDSTNAIQNQDISTNNENNKLKLSNNVLTASMEKEKEKEKEKSDSTNSIQNQDISTNNENNKLKLSNNVLTASMEKEKEKEKEKEMEKKVDQVMPSEEGKEKEVVEKPPEIEGVNGGDVGQPKREETSPKARPRVPPFFDVKVRAQKKREGKKDPPNYHPKLFTVKIPKSQIDVAYLDKRFPSDFYLEFEFASVPPDIKPKCSPNEIENTPAFWESIRNPLRGDTKDGSICFNQDGIEAKLLETKKLFSPSNAPIEKGGWIIKQGHAVKNWKRRWFVLHPEVIEYYKKPNSGTPAGRILIKDIYAVQEIEEGGEEAVSNELRTRVENLDEERERRSSNFTISYGGYKNLFVIHAQEMNYYCSCENDQQREDWIDSITTAVQLFQLKESERHHNLGHLSIQILSANIHPKFLLNPSCFVIIQCGERRYRTDTHYYSLCPQMLSSWCA